MISRFTSLIHVARKFPVASTTMTMPLRLLVQAATLAVYTQPIDRLAQAAHLVIVSTFKKVNLSEIVFFLFLL